MSEIFVIQCENIAVSAGQDILAAYSGSSVKLKLLSVQLAANGQTVVGNYPIRIRYLPATVTAGSGGSAVTPGNVDPNGSSATFTARRNDTSHATTGGTAVDIADQFNPINNYYWQPPREDAALKANLNGAIVLSLDASPAGSINVSATLMIEQI